MGVGGSPYLPTLRNLADQTSVACQHSSTTLSNCISTNRDPSPPTNAIWISSTTGRPLTTKNLGTLISKITLETIGVDVSPHLFRTAAASTAAAYGGNTPHLASAVLNHTDPRVTEEHYNRASSMNASRIYARITAGFLDD